MEYKPHEYQALTTDYIIAHRECAIMLDMGLGKTVSTLTAIHELIFDYMDVAKVLVIAPLRVARDTWKDEIEKWDHLSDLTYSVVVDKSQKRRLEALNKNVAVYFTNRENLKWLSQNMPKGLTFDMIVIDELSSFKDYSSKRYKILKNLKPFGCRMVGLTGTPAPNGLMDLFGEIGILDSGKHLGRFITHFRAKYFNQYGRYEYKLKDGAEEAIYDSIADMSISMKAVDYLKMPELITTNTYVELTDKELAQYKQFKEDFLTELPDGTIIDGKTAATLQNKLLQLSNGFLYDGEGNVHRLHQHKIDALRDIIEEAQGSNLMVAYWFKEDRDFILREIPEAQELKSAESMREWNAKKIKVGLIHPASAGHGLNLQQGGSIIVWYGLTWSLELYAQLNARLYRQGQQSKSVIVRHIITKNTYDTKVIHALEHKETTQASLIEALKAELAID